MDRYIPMNQHQNNVYLHQGKFKPFRFIDIPHDPSSPDQKVIDYDPNTYTDEESSQRSESSRDLYNELVSLQQIIKESKYANIQLSNEKEGLQQEVDELRNIIHKQNSLIGTVRERYSEFCKKLSDDNDQLKFQLKNNQDCYTLLSQEFKKVQDENHQLLQSHENMKKEISKSQSAANEIAGYKRVMDELYKDKKELKDEVRILKKRVKKHKYRYRTLNKVLNDQQAIKFPYNWTFHNASVENRESLDAQTQFHKTLNQQAYYPSKINKVNDPHDSYVCHNDSINESRVSKNMLQRYPSYDNSNSRNRILKDSLVEGSPEDSRVIDHKNPSAMASSGKDLKPLMPNSANTPLKYPNTPELNAYVDLKPRHEHQNSVPVKNPYSIEKIKATQNKPGLLSYKDYLDNTFGSDKNKIQEIKVETHPQVQKKSCDKRNKRSCSHSSMKHFTEPPKTEEAFKPSRKYYNGINGGNKVHHTSRDIQRFGPTSSKKGLNVSPTPALTFGQSRMNSSPQITEKENQLPPQTSDNDDSYKESSKVSTQQDNNGGRNTKGLIHEIESLDEEILYLQKTLMEALIQTSTQTE
ncbi:unnamed protein product [Moneuplotes crassus]|uniref:Uncharacterized protein n=1 Tax=Euplotes crassus TaxID=5936 RepID=A0AAD1X5F2_EUPCR|nr:unnamed protein product [Moneuplotes crassus]